MAPRFVFFAGKGGVGKTTCAAAAAVQAAADGERVLAISTDPAHSLRDALGRARVARLDVVELDARQAYRAWLRRHGRALGDILEDGTWLDRDDVDALLGLSIPGIDELMALLEIVGEGRDGRRSPKAPHSLVVVDTAPTGHTLRLLAAPGVVAAVAEALDALEEEQRLIRRRFGRIDKPAAADRLIALLSEQAEASAALLRDAKRTTFRWVLLPEALSLAESEDGVAALARAGIRVPELIVNRVLPDGPPCPVCDRRRREERRVLGEVRRTLGSKRKILIVDAALHEPRGAAALKKLVPRPWSFVAGPRSLVPGRSDGTAYSTAAGRRTPPESLAALRDARLLFFGGKGGVGKTTCAAAAAVRLARAAGGARVLLLSTDPAHSLGDVFGVPIGDRERSIPGAPPNLRVRELDAAAVLASRRASLEEAFTEIAGSLGAASFDGASELMDLAPPGIDELFGVLSVSEELARSIVVVDTAPTGHTLRLLEMPDAAREWVRTLMRMLLKYRRLARPGKLAAELVELSKEIARLRETLRDPARSRFVVVSRPAEVPGMETARLVARLRRLRVPVPALVLNAMTLAPRACPRCRAVAADERGPLRAAVSAFRRRDCAIILTPLAAPPPRGVEALDRWAAQWTSR